VAIWDPGLDVSLMTNHNSLAGVAPLRVAWRTWRDRGTSAGKLRRLRNGRSGMAFSRPEMGYTSTDCRS
jgi:hypothetical protein